ncbi:MAG: glycosyltransferase [Anaerolineae bacterium]
MTNSIGAKRLRVLRLETMISATSASYFQFSIPKKDEYDITICTYFKNDFTTDPRIPLVEGDNTLIGFYRCLKSLLNQTRFDVVHIHTPHLGVMFLIAVLLGWTTRRHTVYTVHNSFQNFKLRNRLLMIPCFAFLAEVVCCGRASYESMPPFYRWLAGRRLKMIPNSVNLDLIDATLTEMPAVEKTVFTVVWIGRLIPIKNTSTMLRAFAQVAAPTDRLVIIGEGSLDAALRAEAAASGSARPSDSPD